MQRAGCIYVGAVSGSASQLRREIAQTANWYWSSSSAQAWPSLFSVYSDPPSRPQPPSLPPSQPRSPPPPIAPPAPPAPPSPPPAPPLSAGDCMVVGVSTGDGAKDFGIVLLAPLAQGVTVWAADDGWWTHFTPNGFSGNSKDFHVAHTA
eukprot:1164939-Prymnesium_polylepis.2